ncbi:MAG: LysR family transcriptional regulator [Thermoleophilia bacterium]
MATGGTHDDGAGREPSIAELRAFVAVAEELHFRRAASRLGMAPPPLSQMIRRLERKVGAVLLERTPRSVVLTEAGSELLPRARDILIRMAEAQLAVGQAADHHARALRVGIMSNGFAELTGPILDVFRRAHPRVRIDLVDITSEPGAGVIHGEADVCLLRPPVPEQDDPRVRIEDVVMEPRAALLTRRHRLAEADRVSVADLADERWVATGPTLPAVRDFWAVADQRDGEPVRYDVEAWTVPDVIRGVGYQQNVITSFASITRFFRIPGVVAVPMPDVPPAPMSIATRPGDDRPAVTDFTSIARTVSAQMIDLVPGAFLASA